MRLIVQFVHQIPAGENLRITDIVAVPLSINTVLDSSLVTIGRKQFFRVSEDVVVDSRLLFGAGAIASGYICAIEKDGNGHCIAIGIELARVQATDKSQMALRPALIHLKNRVEDSMGVKVQIEGNVQAQANLYTMPRF